MKKTDRSREKSRGARGGQSKKSYSMDTSGVDSILLNEEAIHAQLREAASNRRNADSDEEDDSLKFNNNFKKNIPTAVAEDSDDDTPAAVAAAAAPGNRKEREAAAKVAAAEAHAQRTMRGETAEAKEMLARLAIVRARREAAEAKRASEGRAPGWSANGIESDDNDSDDSEDEAPKESIQEKMARDAKAAKEAERRAAALAALPSKSSQEKAKAAEAVDDNNGELPRLKAMDIKKMNGDALKDACKDRGLSYVGQKKDLIKRLTDYEAAR